MEDVILLFIISLSCLLLVLHATLSRQTVSRSTSAHDSSTFVTSVKLSVPAFGYDGPIMSYFTALRFSKHADEILREGCEKYKDRAFKVPLLVRWLVIIKSRTLLETLRSGLDDVLSFHEAIRELLQVDHTLGPQILDHPYHINIIQSKLNKNFQHLLPLIRDEAAHAFEVHIGSKLDRQEWTPMYIRDPFTQIVCHIGGRSFVGLPLCRNEEYCKLSIRFANNVTAAAGVINLCPRVLKSFVGTMHNKLSRYQTNMRKLLEPEIAVRRSKYQEEGVDYQDKPNDMLAWILESANPEIEQTTESIALRILDVNFMSIHSTYVFFAHSVYNLAAQPGYLDILREEAYMHLNISGTEERWSFEDLENCVKLDSFLKETLRLNDLGSIALPRKALAPLTLVDGTVIPTGTIVTCASRSAHLNCAHYKDPKTFDGLRFARLREDCGSSKNCGDRSSKYCLTSVGSEFLTFGGGRHTCPGRFFASLVLKCVLVHLVLNFDVKMEEEGVRPQDEWTGSIRMPSQHARVMFRRRKIR